MVKEGNMFRNKQKCVLLRSGLVWCEELMRNNTP